MNEHNLTADQLAEQAGSMEATRVVAGLTAASGVRPND